MSLKISTIVDDKAWKDLKHLSKETHQSLTGMLTEAIEEYVRRRKVRPIFLKHMNDSLSEHKKLGELLAK